MHLRRVIRLFKVNPSIIECFYAGDKYRLLIFLWKSYTVAKDLICREISFNNFGNNALADPTVIENPCNPSPCGPNSRCQSFNNQAVCTCISGFIGNPPACRPECVVNTDCALNEACINTKCGNPCLGACGISARCQVLNHNPICSCPPVFTGDPFVRCIPRRRFSFFILKNFHVYTHSC